MKVVWQVCASSNFGGGEKVAFDIVEHLSIFCNFVIFLPEGFYRNLYNDKGIDCRLLSKNGIVKNVWLLRKNIKSSFPDIIHCHGTRAALWVRLSVIGLKKKPVIVYTLHGFHLVSRRFLPSLVLCIERFLNRWVDIMVVVSESDRKLVEKWSMIHFSKIKLIKNGIDLDNYDKNYSKTEYEDGYFKFLMPARLHTPKDFFTLLRAFKIFISKNTNKTILLIAGEGPLLIPILETIDKLSLNDNVKMLGFRTDILSLMKKSDVVVLSTEWEGLPLVILEAGISSKPVICSNVRGVNDCVIDGKTGLLFNFGDEIDLFFKMTELYKNKERCSVMGKNAFEYVVSNFSLKDSIEKYFLIYDKKV